MKRLTLILVAAVALLTFAIPATADTFTAAEQASAAKFIYESPPTQRAMQGFVPRIMAWLNDLKAVTTGKGASLIGIFDTAGKITATNAEAAFAEIAADGWVTGAHVANYGVTLGKIAPSGCTAGQYPGANAGATGFECKDAPATAAQGGLAATALQPLVPLVPHSIVTLAGTTGAIESSEIQVAEFPRIVRTRISAPADANPHDLSWSIPAGAIVLDAWATVVTADADPGGLTIDLGVNGAPDGFFKALPIDATATKTCSPALDGTYNWVASTLCGSNLALAVAGTNADDRGLWVRFPDETSGGKALAYQASGAATAVVDLYIVIALP